MTFTSTSNSSTTNWTGSARTRCVERICWTHLSSVRTAVEPQPRRQTEHVASLGEEKAIANQERSTALPRLSADSPMIASQSKGPPKPGVP